MNNIDIALASKIADFIKNKFACAIPNLAVILGSGLGDFTQIVKTIKTISYTEIPGFPQSSVLGHKGSLTIVELDNGKHALVMEGRFHYYEGYSPSEVVLPIVVFHQLGIKYLIVSNAAGGINSAFSKGDLMIINDHINFTGNHPLIGKNDNTLGPRFLDQTECYSNELIRHAKTVAKKLNIHPKEGVYIAVSGPTYETKAEIRAFRALGADAVGMSTVYEVIMANYLGIKVLGISSITNMATGMAKVKHDHGAIVGVAGSVSMQFSSWVKQIILEL
jgi:purine-nucleoside phosphorylase